MPDLSVLKDIAANLLALEIDEIKKRLEPLLKGMTVESPVFDPGEFLYRARKVDPTFGKQAGIKYADLIYPPKPKLGRLNWWGQPALYCSTSKETIFFELQELRAGDEVILTLWRTKEKMVVNNIGYTHCVFEKLGSKRPCPQWIFRSSEHEGHQATIEMPQNSRLEIETEMPLDANRELREALSEYFMRSVERTQTDQYKLTTAIGELHLGTITNHENQFAGILYPSVRMWANGDNLALLPWFVDRHLEFRKALHVRIDVQEETKFSITDIDCAKEFDEDGRLIWVGRIPNWTLERSGQKAKFTLSPGPDSDGDYQTSLDGMPCHWTAVDADTNRPIEAR